MTLRSEVFEDIEIDHLGFGVLGPAEQPVVEVEKVNIRRWLWLQWEMSDWQYL